MQSSFSYGSLSWNEGHPASPRAYASEDGCSRQRSLQAASTPPINRWTARSNPPILPLGPLIGADLGCCAEWGRVDDPELRSLLQSRSLAGDCHRDFSCQGKHCTFLEHVTWSARRLPKRRPQALLRYPHTLARPVFFLVSSTPHRKPHYYSSSI